MSDSSFPCFQPHPLLRNGHLQTIAGAYLNTSCVIPPAQKHRLRLADGDTLILHDNCPSNWQPNDSSVILAHGLTGTHSTSYMVRTAAKLLARGCRTFRLDLRGCGDGFLLAQGLGHAGRSEDLFSAVQKVTAICPDSSLTCVGFSLSGNMLLKMLGERPQALPNQLENAVSISAPIDTRLCSLTMQKGISRFYGTKFVRELMRQLRKKQAAISGFNREKLYPTPRTMFEFDDHVTAPLSGFENAAAYYREASSVRVVEHITTRTLVVSAVDDPLVPVRTYQEAKFSTAVTLDIQQHGGHLGFVSAKKVQSDRRWLDQRITEWIMPKRNSRKI